MSPFVEYAESKCKSVICQKYPEIKRENKSVALNTRPSFMYIDTSAHIWQGREKCLIFVWVESKKKLFAWAEKHNPLSDC